MRVPGLVLVLLTALGCDQCQVDPLVGYCEPDLPCLDQEGEVDLDPDVPNHTVCFVGHTECTEEDKQVCVGQIPCRSEICNGLDDDGDGEIDDHTQTRYNPVTFQGLCDDVVGTGCSGDVWVECVNGQKTCFVEDRCVPEICDGLDNDGNGEVDDIDPEYFYPDDQFPGTVGIGECRPGIIYCSEGRLTTVPPRGPRPEEQGCGNGLDDDCDGLTDESDDGTPDAPAIVFVVDVSGSISNFMASMREGFCDLSENVSTLTNGQAQFALVTYADDAWTGEPYNFVGIAQGFTDDPDLICEALLNNLSQRSGAEEYQIEGVMAVADMTWPSFERHVILASDEDIHGFGDETVLEGMDRIVESCTTMPFTTHAFLTDYTMWEWQPMMDACGGYPAHALASSLYASDYILPEMTGSCFD